MRFPECLDRPTADNRFLGVPIAQTWHDLALWEAFLCAHPPAAVIELGTWQGGMAAFFGVQGIARGFTTATIDRPGHTSEGRELLAKLGVERLELDLFSQQGILDVQSLIAARPRPLLLSLDNGDKRSEWRLFVPSLRLGDLVSVHDWGSEFGTQDRIPLLEPLFEAECEGSNSMTRFFRVPYSEESQR